MERTSIPNEPALPRLVVPEICPSCGHAFAGKFCSACGEKKVAAHDFTLRHFIEESVEGFTHFDNKLLRTLRSLFFKPGSLTASFESGQRVTYMKPVQLFIISNLVFFILSGGLNL